MAIPVLLYHSVAGDVDGAFAPYTVSPATFARHLDLVVESGSTALTFSGLVDALTGAAPMPERPVVITFDDGFADFATAAWPELATRRLPATLYVTTGALGSTSTWLERDGAGDRPMLTWDDVVALDAAGCEIGAHTVTHVPLDCVDRPLAEREIRGSRAALEDALGHEVRTFAYPHGHHDRHVRRLVIDAGFESAAAVRNALSHPRDDVFAVARVTVRRDDSDARIAELIDGRGAPIAPRRELARTKVWRRVRRHRHRSADATIATATP